MKEPNMNSTRIERALLRNRSIAAVGYLHARLGRSMDWLTDASDRSYHEYREGYLTAANHEFGTVTGTVTPLTVVFPEDWTILNATKRAGLKLTATDRLIVTHALRQFGPPTGPWPDEGTLPFFVIGYVVDCLREWELHLVELDRKRGLETYEEQTLGNIRTALDKIVSIRVEVA